MQDKDLDNNINEEFTDFAWGEMHKILDRELPVKKKKKRFAFWLFLGLSAMLFLFLIYFNFTKPAIPIERVELPIVNNEINQTQDIVANSKEELSTNPIEELKVSSLEKTRIIPKSSQVDKAIKTKFNPIIKTKNFTPNPENLFTKEINLERVTNKLIPPDKLESKFQTQNVLGELPQIKTLELVEKFANDRLAHIELEQNNKSKNFWQKLKPVGLTLRAGAQNNDFKTPIGFHAGFSLDYKLSNNLGINIGLEYQLSRNHYPMDIVKNGSDANDLTSRFLAEQEVFPPVVSGQNPSILDADLILRIDKMHYLNLPVNFYYQFHRNWNINLGFQFSYLLKLNAGQFEYGTNELLMDGLVNTPIPTLDGLNTIDSNLRQELLDRAYAEGFFFRKLSFANSIGVSYFPTQRLGIDLKYNFGFPNILKNRLGDGFRNSNLQLSLSYKLFKP